MANKLNSCRVGEFCNVKSALVWLRIVPAFLLIYNHGWPKLMMVLNGNFEWMDPIGIGPMFSLILATFAEFVCSLLVLIGLYTRGACIILMINFFVALVFHHIGLAFGTFESALLYFSIFLTIFLTGPGKFSIDNAMHSNNGMKRSY